MSKPYHWGCAFNEERGPFTTRKAQCGGEVIYKDGPRIWVCEAHESLLDEPAASAEHARHGGS